MLKKLRQWFNQDADELDAEKATMTPHERAELTDYEENKVNTGGGGYAREPQTDFERDSERPRY
jgi:hypothetical protein